MIKLNSLKTYKLDIPSNICLQINGQHIIVKEDNNWFYFPNSNDIDYFLPEYIKITRKPNNIDYTHLEFSLKEGFEKFFKKYKKMCPLYIKILKNKIYGNLQGFEKTLILSGDNYKLKLDNNFIILYVGFSKPIFIKIPSNIQLFLENSNKIILKSKDNIALGNFANLIRECKPIEPYKNKGFYYLGEKIKLKAYKKTKK